MKKIFSLLLLLLLIQSTAHGFNITKSGNVSDDGYGAGWNGVTAIAPSQNSVYDKIETLAGGHDAVTLGVDADILLGLSTQQLTFDTQTANYVLAGPTSGAAADPTFRALVDADVPDNVTISLAGTATALAADPTDCAANTYATTIAASGNLTCATVGIAGLSSADFGNFTCNGAACTIDNASITPAMLPQTGITDEYCLTYESTGTTMEWQTCGTGGTGDVVGPAVSVDNTIPRYDSTTGKLLQGSGIVIDDSDAMTFNNAAAPAILSVAATSTVPTLVPNKADLDTGIGWAAANALSLTAGATEGVRITQTPIGAGQTVASLTHTKSAVLGKDTTNEVAYTLNYTTNKAAGNDTGLLINMTDIQSPGISYLIDAQKGGTTTFYVTGAGAIFAGAGITAPNLIATTDNTRFYLQNRDFTGSNYMIQMAYGTFSGAGVTQAAIVIMPTYNQSTTSAGTDLLINRTETTVGSGAQYLTQFQVGAANVEILTNKGHHIVDDAVALTYPALTVCGTAPTLSAGSNDYAGTFVIGATGTGCTITFGTAYTNAPACITSGSAAITNTQTNAVLTVVAIPGTYNYICIGLNSGI